MMITVKELVDSSSGVDEFEVHGKQDQEYLAIGREYGFFFRSDLEVNQAFDKFKDRQIESFRFYSQSEGWTVCEIYLKD